MFELLGMFGHVQFLWENSCTGRREEHGHVRDDGRNTDMYGTTGGTRFGEFMFSYVWTCTGRREEHGRVGCVQEGGRVTMSV